LIRKPLALVLLASALLSAWAVWWPRSQPVQRLVQAVERSQDARVQATSDLLGGAAAGGILPATAATAPLPQELPEVLVAAARRDPFLPYQPPAPPPPKVPKIAMPATPMPVAPVPPPLPQPIAMPPPEPTVSFRYLGRFVSPQGQRTVYLEGPNATVMPVAAGTRLEGGWVVSALNDDSIELSPAGEGPKTKIDIPPPPPAGALSDSLRAAVK
jgi:hypothetical protein